MLQIFALIGALFLVALNGFFVAAEFGLVKLRATRVKTLARKHGLRGRILGIVHGRLDAYLSACQLGITLASLGLGWVGEPAFAQLLGPLLDLIGVESERVVHLISLVFAFSLISFLHIVVGELAPKSMAIRQPEKVGLWVALPLYAFYWAMYPAIWVLNNSANAVLRLAGLGRPRQRRPLLDRRAEADPAQPPQHGRQSGPAGARHVQQRRVEHTRAFARLFVDDRVGPDAAGP